MSEYQYVHFIAVDRLLTDRELAYMEKQSSRAEISKQSFVVEYNYSDFRGNSEEMLRHGYDVHLEYCNYGTRKVMLRLASGLPCEKSLFKKFLPEYGVAWLKDKSGPGGILSISPESDGGSYDYLDDVSDIAEALVSIRESLITGDLRPLYLAWLVCCPDEDAIESPVPAGLMDRSPAFEEMARFYELSDFLLDAAAELSSKPLAKSDAAKTTKTWLASKSPAEIAAIVEEILISDPSGVKSKLLSEIREAAPASIWPLTPGTRTLKQLRTRQGELETSWQERETKKEEKRIAKKLKSIADDPQGTEKKIIQLVTTGDRDKLKEAAKLLDDFANVVGKVQAKVLSAKLIASHSSIRGLRATLKRHGYT